MRLIDVIWRLREFRKEAREAEMPELAKHFGRQIDTLEETMYEGFFRSRKAVSEYMAGLERQVELHIDKDDAASRRTVEHARYMQGTLSYLFLVEDLED